MEKQDIGNEAISFIVDTLRDPKAFVADQAPEICQEILARGFIVNGVGVVATLIILIVSAVYGKKAIKEFLTLRAKPYGDRKGEDGAFGASLICGLVFVASTIIFISKLMSVLVIYAAPKLYIIKQLTLLL